MGESQSSTLPKGNKVWRRHGVLVFRPVIKSPSNHSHAFLGALKWNFPTPTSAVNLRLSSVYGRRKTWCPVLCKLFIKVHLWAFPWEETLHYSSGMEKENLNYESGLILTWADYAHGLSVWLLPGGRVSRLLALSSTLLRDWILFELMPLQSSCQREEQIMSIKAYCTG